MGAGRDKREAAGPAQSSHRSCYERDLIAPYRLMRLLFQGRAIYQTDIRGTTIASVDATPRDEGFA